MKRIGCLVIFASISMFIYAQEGKVEKESIKLFYKLLYTKNKISVKEISNIFYEASEAGEASFVLHNQNCTNCNYNLLKQEITKNADTLTSNIFKEIMKYKDQLTQGLEYSKIDNLIDSSSFLSDGMQFSELVRVKFPNNYEVYFEISGRLDQIFSIWLPSGECLVPKILRNTMAPKLERPGIINDEDGYTNIREKPFRNSAIIGKFLKNEIFYYTPVSGEEWWPVYKKEGEPQIGYIHKSKIKTYADFSKEIKEKVDKERGGC